MYRSIPIRVSMVALACLFLTGAPAAQTQNQQPGPPGTIRIRVRLIPVDVTVTDRSGKPVEDLRQEDFQIFEDGHPQEIRHFSVQRFLGDAGKPGQQQAQASGTALEIAPQPARTFLILMGRGRHQRPLKAVDALIRFVRDDLLPQDRIAVFAYNRATDFTTDHDRVIEVLERYKKTNDTIESWIESRLRGLAAVYGVKDLPKSFQGEIDKIFENNGSLASRRVPPGRVTEKGSIVRDWDRAADMLLKDSDRAAEETVRTEVAEAVAEEGGAGSQVMLSLIKFDTLDGDFVTLSLGFDDFAPKAATSFLDLQNLYTSIEYLRYVEGQKHLIFLTGDGLLFPGGDTSYDHGLLTAANDARVAIETFQTGGLFADPEIVPTKGVTLPGVQRGSQNPLPPEPPALSATNWSRAFMLSVLGNLSERTGGRASVGEDIGKSLDRLNNATRVQYLLGYYPQDDHWDGRYRQIHVKVSRPGVKVSSRQGYFTRDILRPYDRQEFFSYNRIAAAGAYESEVGDIPFKTTAATTTDAGGPPQIKVDLQIDAEKVGFKMVDARHLDSLSIAIFYADKDGKYLGDNWHTVNLNLTEQTYQQVMKTGILFSGLVPQKVPNQILKVIVYDAGNDKVGSKVVKMR